MQSLLNGADCSTSSNPLNQVLKREGVDNSLFRDRVVPSHGPDSSRSQIRPLPHDNALNPITQSNLVPHPFNLSHLSAALSQAQPHSPNPAALNPSHRATPDLNAEWERYQVARNQVWDRHPQQHKPMTQTREPIIGPQAQAQQQHLGQPAVSSAWADAFHQDLNVGGKGKGKAQEFQNEFTKSPSQSTLPISTQGFMGSSMYGNFGLPPDPFVFNQLPSYQPRHSIYSTMANGGGSGGVVGSGNEAQGQEGVVRASGLTHAAHAEMEAAFERALEDARAQTLGVDGRAVNQVDKEAKQKEGEKGMEAGAFDVREEEDKEKEFKGDLEAVWESLKPEAERLNKLAEWEREFSQFTSGEDDTFDILNESLNRDDVGQTPIDEQFEFGIPRTTENGPGIEKAAMDAYQFVTPNPFINHSPTAAWSEADRLLATGQSQSLTNGALLIESFLQNATTEDYAMRNGHSIEAEAWCRLGKVQAEDEREEKALSAFEQGRKVLELQRKNGEVVDKQVVAELLTNLAISYVNESLDLEALSTLHHFLTISYPTYAGPVPSRTELTSSSSPWALHEQLTNSFLSLARDQYRASESSSSPSSQHQQEPGKVDPDVQVALGTCYYMMGEYNDARNCWVSALGERPNDYLLWNRLGATLANGGEPEEAVDAYRRALEIKPGFTRAIYNLGVACLNIGVYREAAEHFLAALSLHASEPQDQPASSAESSSLWGTLRRSLISLDMPELAEQARPGTDLQVFRRAGFQF